MSNSRLNEEAQKVVMAAGLKKPAEVASKDVIAKMALDRFSRKLGMNKGTFDNKQGVEAWLDENV